jgi:hypothetical protein
VLKLEVKNGELFALDSSGNLIGKVINNLSGGCENNPVSVEAGLFSSVYSGHGDVYHFSDNPPNPFFRRAEDVIENIELLPFGTEHLFLDASPNAICDYYTVPCNTN